MLNFNLRAAFIQSIPLPLTTGRHCIHITSFRTRQTPWQTPLHHRAPLRTYPRAAAAALPPTTTKPTPARKPHSLNSTSILHLISPEWKSLTAAILAALLSSAILLLTPIAFGRVLDIVSSFHRTGTAEGLAQLNRGAVRLLIVYAFGAVARMVETALMLVAGERIVSSLRRRVFSSIVRADVATLESTTTGELMSRLSSDTSALQRVMTTDVNKMLQGGLETLVASIMLSVLCARLATLIYLTVPLSIFAGFYYGNRTSSLAKALSGALANASQVASEQLNGIRIVKSFAREPFAESQYNDKVQQVLKLGYKSALAEGILQGWNRAIFTSVTCAILLFGGRLIAAGVLSVGSMMAFILYTSNLSAAVGKLSSGIGEVVRAAGAVERVMEILDTKPTIERYGKFSAEYADVGFGAGLNAMAGSVEFRNVSFRYQENEREVLKNINFTIPAGGSAAFVGGSGGGKSTALTLMSRFYEPTNGEILLDGKPLENYNLRDLRQSVIGIVSQEPFLISGTVADNIRYGRADATDDEIREAAEAAGVMEYVHRLPDGLNTTVRRLSGGEQQRLMIARCLVKNPSIVVLDEPTSALDRRNEAVVNATIEKLMRDKSRTVILISHQLANVKECELILVFDKGEVVEQGTHDCLVERDGAYCKLLSGSK